ncbi:MAG: M48 family metallopeptidase [Proteobacteria bacterium]|nr:M48 family metallopeptidase [Pseudomonadota bacterium]
MQSSSLLSGLAACLIAFMFAGCATSTAPGAIGTDRRQLLLVSSEQMNQMAEQAYSDMKAGASNEGILNRDSALLNRVRAAGTRIYPHIAVFRPDALEWNWELNVLQSDELNAFCMPGGKIMFYSGLIQQLDLSDAEIAIVMGHEIAHALREHSREQMSNALAAQAAIGVGAAVLGLGQGAADLAGTGYQALIATRFSRIDETEADRMGLELVARAGYDPRAGITLWQKMINANQGGRPPALLSSHPAEADRVRQIERLLPRVMPLYTAADK